MSTGTRGNTQRFPAEQRMFYQCDDRRPACIANSFFEFDLAGAHPLNAIRECRLFMEPCVRPA